MNVLNRAEIPVFGQVEQIALTPPKKQVLDNGLEVYFGEAGPVEMVKLEFVFPAGQKWALRPLVAKATATLLKNGTTHRSAKEIAEEVDNVGAFLETACTKDKATISVYTLSKHLESVLEVVMDMILNATFPEEELATYCENGKQKLLINLEKVSVLARRQFGALLFGEDHPYGRVNEVGDFDQLKREELLAFKARYYSLSNCKVYVVAGDEMHTMGVLAKQLGAAPVEQSNIEGQSLASAFATNLGKKRIAKKDALQAAIRMGCMSINRSHPDYHGMVVLNTVLGGYFGSRLMANIREDKGYTYGINSGLLTLQEAGYFVIATEVGSQVAGDAIGEIYKEIDRLKATAVPNDELELVKNYLLGSFLRSMDGAFAQIEKFQALHAHGLTSSFYEDYLNVIKRIQPVDLQRLANEYLNTDQFVELCVGAG
jgi:predicted Zn-dependent peptidase